MADILNSQEFVCIYQTLKSWTTDQCYPKSNILNAFLKLKIEQNLEEDNTAFDTIYTHLSKNIGSCNISTCKLIQRHFRDRTISMHNESEYEPKEEIAKDTLARIHSYFMHSYDIHRLSPNALNCIQSQNQNDDDEKLNNSQPKLIANIMQKKRENYIESMSHRNRKYIQINYSFVDDIDDIKSSSPRSQYDEEKKVKINNFTAITSTTQSIAIQFLEALKWDIESAMDRFFRTNGDVSRLPVVEQPQQIEEKKEENDEKVQYDEIMNIGMSDLKFETKKFANLKEEMLNNEWIKCSQMHWNMLNEECNQLLESVHVKLKTGFFTNFSLLHLHAIKLFTDYISWRYELCDAFMANNKQKLLSFGNWCSLLLECTKKGIGQSLDDESNRFYRVFESEFVFEKYVFMFNMPTSVTSKFEICQQFVGNTDGVIVELSQLSISCRYFECDAISSFDSECEILIFQSAVLQIQSIYHQATSLYDVHWIGALKNLLNLMHNVPISSDMSNAGKQKLKSMLEHILQNKVQNLPNYIGQLLMNHLENAPKTIEFVIDLLISYDWLKSIFVKDEFDDTSMKFLNISNLCKLFKQCKTVIIRMPKHFILNKVICECLLNEMQNIPNDVTLIFRWSENMSIKNHANFEVFKQSFFQIHWQAQTSANAIKFTNIAQFSDENEISQQQQIWNQLHGNSDNQSNEVTFNATEDKVPFLVNGYIRNYFNHLLIPLEIVKLCILLFGDFHSIFWRIYGDDYQNLVNAQDSNDILLLSAPYTIQILDYTMKFQLRVKINSVGSQREIMLKLHQMSDDMDIKQAATVRYIMRCEETQCEYRQMCVIDGEEGSGWFDDYLTLSELKNLNVSELNFCCNISVLHIWSQHEIENDDFEFMNVYHSNSKIHQKYAYEWNLSHALPSSVSKEATLCYSPMFDEKAWTLIFGETDDTLCCGLKLLSIPFGIGLLVVNVQFMVWRKDKFVSDRIVENYKYGEDEFDLGHSKEWKKSELFGKEWNTEFNLSELRVECKLEIIHMEGINEEQVFKINWPLYGVLCDDDDLERSDKHSSFRITKDQFDAESFGFNYMIGRLKDEVNDLKSEIERMREEQKRMKVREVKGNEMEYIVNDEGEVEEMKEWLKEIDMMNYFELLMKNGFNSMDMIKEINDKNDLQFIGIEIKAHQIKLMNKINSLKN